MLAKFTRWEKAILALSLVAIGGAGLLGVLRREQADSFGISVVPVSEVRREAGPVDLNRATSEEIARVPGIGPALAARIVAWREERGSFRTFDDLLKVSGIGPVVLARIRDKVRVGQ